MTINKINYEVYAIDYLEGTLSDQLMREMELFLATNPEIDKELEDIRHFSAPVFSMESYPDKESLKKQRPNKWIPILGIAASLLILVLWIVSTGQGTLDAPSENLAEKRMDPIRESSDSYSEHQPTVESRDKLAKNKLQLNQAQEGTKETAEIEVAESIGSNPAVESNPLSMENETQAKKAPSHMQVQKITDVLVTNRGTESELDEKVFHTRSIDRTESPKEDVLAELTPLPAVKANPIVLPNIELPNFKETALTMGNSKFPNSLKPEAFAKKNTWKDIKEALLPESFAGILSKD